MEIAGGAQDGGGSGGRTCPHHTRAAPSQLPLLVHKAPEKGPCQPLQPPMRPAVSALPRMSHSLTHCLLHLECFSLMENSYSAFKTQLGSSSCIKQSLRCPPPQQTLPLLCSAADLPLHGGPHSHPSVSTTRLSSGTRQRLWNTVSTVCWAWTRWPGIRAHVPRLATQGGVWTGLHPTSPLFSMSPLVA